jgi:DNA-binding response OmpR family regulator
MTSTRSCGPIDVNPRTVLLVEDDDDLRRALVRGLDLHSLSVVETATAEDALARVGRAQPDLMVVDIGLPGMSGIALCAELRERGCEVPILILSARDAVGDRVEGLRAGADDYLVKPFDLDELAARLHALLRRATRPASASTATIVVDPLWIDLDRRVVKVGPERVDLSRREFDLLAALATNRDIVLSRVRLLELVWGYDFEVDTNVVDVFVGYLRRKLAAAGVEGLIQTVRGVGFVLRPR